MRTALRIVAGLMALGFIALLIFADRPTMSLRDQFGMGVISIAFGAYSLFGVQAGERMLSIFFGTPTTEAQEPPKSS